MSTLQDLLVVLDSVTKEAEHYAAHLEQHARRLEQVVRNMTSMMQGSARADNNQTTTFLYMAQQSVSQAARHLHQAALAGKGFVSRHAGSGSGAAAGTIEGRGAAGGSAPAFDAADVAALSDYTGEGFREINESLRSGESVNPGVSQRAAAVSEALSKLPDWNGPVFRGTMLTPDQIASYVPGEVHSEAGFTSTTSDRKIAFPGNTLFLITSKHGKNVSPYSVYAESEILFDKNTDFLVTSNYFSSQEGKRIIVMMEV